MTDLVPLAVMLVVGLTGLSLLTIVVFGARSLAFGKVKPQTMVLIGLPLLIFAVLGAVLGDWPKAGVLTVAITFGLSLLGLLATSLRGMVGL